MLTLSGASGLIADFMSTNDYRPPLDGEKMRANLMRCLEKWVGVAPDNGEPTELFPTTIEPPDGATAPSGVPETSAAEIPMLTIREIATGNLASLPANLPIPDGWEVVTPDPK